MAKEYPNSGIMYPNDRRKTDKHPEYTGSINVAGVDYWLSAWVKDGKKGQFFSLSVKPKDAARPKPRDARPGPDNNPKESFDDSDVPF